MGLSEDLGGRTLDGRRALDERLARIHVHCGALGGVHECEPYVWIYEVCSRRSKGDGESARCRSIINLWKKMTLVRSYFLKEIASSIFSSR